MDIRNRYFIEEVTRLRKRENRDKTGLTIVEGYPEVHRAVKAKVPVHKVFICPEIFEDHLQEFRHLNVIKISKETFAGMAFGSRLKGILALCRPEKRHFSSLKLKAAPRIIVVEGVEKPGNLGTIIRSCDGAGIDAVIVCDGKTDVFNHHVVRSSIGTVFTVPVAESSKEETKLFLRRNGIKIFAATSKAEKNYDQTDLSGSTAIVIGNEHEGVSPFWVEHADGLIKIPMLGESGCLNAAVSASILAYESLRQKTHSAVNALRSSH